MADDDDRREQEERERKEREEQEERERKEREEDDAPATLEAARDRLGVLERELAETRRESIKRRDRIRSLESDLAKEREQHMGEAERAVEQARREEREKLQGEHRGERVRSALLLAGATKLRDPQDAIRYVDLDELAAHEDGEIDKAAARAVDDLVEEKDYLAIGADEETSAGARSQGPRQRQPAGGRQRETDMNARIRRQLKR